MKLEEFLDRFNEGTQAQLAHADKQMTKSEGGEITKSMKKLVTHFNSAMDAMDRDGYGMQSLRVAVQFEDMLRMISNIYGNAHDLLELPDRRYEKQRNR